jgi:putative peptidoglycan lipid II flippase
VKDVSEKSRLLPEIARDGGSMTPADSTDRPETPGIPPLADAPEAMPSLKGNEAEGRFLRVSMGVAFLLLATKGVGFLRDPLVAALYGATAASDTFYVALGVANLVYAVMLGGLVASVVPVFLSQRVQAGDRSAWGFLVGFLFWLVVCFAIIAAVLLLFASDVVGLLAPGLDPESRAVAASMLRILSPLPMLTAVTVTFSSALNCYGRFLVPASMPLLGNAVSICLLIGLTPLMGVSGAATAVSIGAGVQALTISWVAVRYARQFAPAFSLFQRELIVAARLAGPGIVAEGLLSIMTFTILFLATSLGPGVYSSIQYGNKLQVVFLDVFIAAISVVMYPHLANAAARKDLVDLRRLSGLSLRLMSLVLLPIAVAIILLRVPLTELVYQRKAFDAVATAQTASALALLAVSLVPHAFKDVCVRAFYAVHDSTTPLRAMGAAVILDIALSVGLVRSLGGNGLVLAYSLAIVFLAGFLVVQLQRRGMLAVDQGMWGELGKIGAGTIVAAGTLSILWRSLNNGGASSFASLGLRVMGCLMVSAVVYLLVLWLLGEEETRLHLASLMSLCRRGVEATRVLTHR